MPNILVQYSYWMEPLLFSMLFCSCTLIVYFYHKTWYVQSVVFASLAEDFFQVAVMQYLASQANGAKSVKLPDSLMNALKTLNGCIGKNKYLLGVSQIVNFSSTFLDKTCRQF